MIALNRAYFQLIREGHKTTTIRPGIRQPEFGSVRFVDGDLELNRSCEIVKLRHLSFGDLTETDAIADGFPSLRVLMDEMRRFYPEERLAPDALCTVIHFTARK